MRRKYIFFDIDHTLVSYVGEPHIPPETREAVRLLSERGHVPAIATGRGEFLSRRVANELGIKLLVCANGAHIFNGDDELYAAWLPDSVVASFLETAAKYPETAVAIDERFIYTDNTKGDFDYYFNNQAGYPCVRPMKYLRRAIMCYIMLPHSELASADYGIFSSPPSGVKLEFMSTFTEARVDGTTKWLGIQRAIRELGADNEDIIAFGDGINDVEMLQGASPGVAVGKSNEKAKEAAAFIAGDIDEGGILTACRDLGLI